MISTQKCLHAEAQAAAADSEVDGHRVQLISDSDCQKHRAAPEFVATRTVPPLQPCIPGPGVDVGFARADRTSSTETRASAWKTARSRWRQ